MTQQVPSRQPPAAVRMIGESDYASMALLPGRPMRPMFLSARQDASHTSKVDHESCLTALPIQEYAPDHVVSFHLVLWGVERAWCPALDLEAYCVQHDTRQWGSPPEFSRLVYHNTGM